MLITPTPFTYFDSKGQVDVHGIVLLRVLSMLQQYEFAKEKLDKLEKLGWKAARLERASDIFKGVQLSMEKDGVEGNNSNPNDVPPPILSAEAVLSRRNRNTYIGPMPKKPRVE